MQKIPQFEPNMEPKKSHHKTENQVINIMGPRNSQHKQSKHETKNTINPKPDILKMIESKAHDYSAKTSVPTEKEIVCLLIGDKQRRKARVSESLVVRNRPVTCVHRHDSKWVEEGDVYYDFS